jgi:hypothetical protein
MPFMEKQIQYNRWIQIDGPCGTDSVPFDVVFSSQNKKTMNPTFEDVRDYTENREAWSIDVVDGYGARLSAPGYMDCTPWSVFKTEQEAAEYLEENYPDDDED